MLNKAADLEPLLGFCQLNIVSVVAVPCRLCACFAEPEGLRFVYVDILDWNGFAGSVPVLDVPRQKSQLPGLIWESKHSLFPYLKQENI